MPFGNGPRDPVGRGRSHPDRRDVLKALAAAGIGGIAGCAGSSPQSGSGQNGTATVGPPAEASVTGNFITGTTGEARSIHPYDLGDEATGGRLDHLFDAGGVTNEDVEFESRWLKSWELSDSADVVEYELYDNLEWGADYGELTAEDYLYNIENVFQVEENWTAYQYTTEFFIEEEPIQVEKTGKYTMRAELPEPRFNWLHDDPITYVIPLPPDLLQPYVENQDLKGLKQDEDITKGRISGNLGPFSFESWTRNSRMVLKRNEEYYLREHVDAYEEAPFFDQLTYQVFDEQSTGYSALQAGDITNIGIEARKVSQFQDKPGIRIWQSKFGSGIFWLNLNHRVNGWAPIRESREVRQAFAHLFDKEVLINQVFNDNANPIDTFTPRWGPYYDDSKIWVPEASVEKAKEKFASGTSSDYAYEDDTFVGPNGEQVELKMVITAGSQSGEIIANFMKQQLSKAGISMTIEATEWSNLLNNFAMNSGENTDWAAGKFNGGPWDQATSNEPWDLMYGLGFSHGAYSPWNVIQTTLAPQGSFNMWGYVTDEFDIQGATDEAAASSSQEEATSLLTDLFGFLSRDQPLVWSFNEHSIVGYREKVQGLPEVVNAFSGPDVDRELYFRQA